MRDFCAASLRSEGLYCAHCTARLRRSGLYCAQRFCTLMLREDMYCAHRDLHCASLLRTARRLARSFARRRLLPAAIAAAAASIRQRVGCQLLPAPASSCPASACQLLACQRQPAPASACPHLPARDSPARAPQGSSPCMHSPTLALDGLWRRQRLQGLRPERASSALARTHRRLPLIGSGGGGGASGSTYLRNHAIWPASSTAIMRIIASTLVAPLSMSADSTPSSVT